jgi:hypothetical protein
MIFNSLYSWYDLQMGQIYSEGEKYEQSFYFGYSLLCFRVEEQARCAWAKLLHTVSKGDVYWGSICVQFADTNSWPQPREINRTNLSAETLLRIRTSSQRTLIHRTQPEINNVSYKQG